jgi:LDH2 family malate/lactate/ureidoglycolate dehydrogenase
MHVTAAEATSAAVAALRGAGVPEKSARIQADLLVDAESRGLASHGLLRLPRLLRRIENGVADPTTIGRHTWAGGALLEVDGQNGLGPVVASAALKTVQARARTTGIACATIRSNNHLGALAWYVRKVAEDGQVCIAMTTTEAIMHPHGGRTALVGTNPVAIGVPTSARPLVFDMATTQVSMGKVHDYANRAQPLQSGWALDRHGDPTTDAAAAKTGALAPFGGAKGYGLGIALEVLVACLTSTALGTAVTGTLNSVDPPTKGDVFIVAQPHSALSLDALGSYLDEVRNSPPAHADTPVSVPGDRSDARREASTARGVEVPDAIWSELVATSGRTTTSTERKRYDQ